MRRLLAGLFLLFSMNCRAGAQEAYQPPVYDVKIPDAIVLSAGKSLPLPSEEEAVSLEEAVRIGLSIHENIDEAQAAVAQAVARVSQSRAPARPYVNFSASYQEPLYYHVHQSGLSGLSSLGGLGGFSLFNQAAQGPQEQLVIRQLLFDFNRTRSAVKAAEARTRAAEAVLEKTKQQLAFEIGTAYLELLQSERLTEVQMLAAENQAIHIDETRKLFDVGIGLPVDVVRAQTEYARAVRQYTDQRNQSLLDRVKLATLMGLDPRTPFLIKAPTVRVNSDASMDDLVDKALAQRPVIAETEAELEAQRFQLENARASNRPRITTSMNLTANQVIPQPKSEAVSLFLNLEWPLYDGGLAKAQAEEAEAAIDGATARLSRAQRQIVQDVSLAYVRLQNASQKLVTSEFEVKGAEESVRVATGRYKLGLGAFLEVLDAEQALVDARTGQINSLTQLEQAEVNLRYAVGDKIVR